MKRPLKTAIPLAVLGSAAAAAVAVGAVIPIYSNRMSSGAARKQIVRISGHSCDRGGGGRALRITVGKRTRECQLRTPVIGANLDVKVTARLLSGTPQALQKKTFVGVSVRDGGDGQYQLAVFPAKGSFQLRRDLPPNADRTLLAKGKSSAVKGLGKANKLRLQAFATKSGTMRVTGFVNGRKVGSVIDDAHAAASLTGRYSALAIGANNAANGAMGSFDNLSIAVPDPF